MKTIQLINCRIIRPLLLAAGFITFCSMASAQSKESYHDLSKAAKKGMLVDAGMNKNGDLTITYKMKVKKKSDEVAYEDYIFSPQLDFKGTQPTKQDKATKPDYTVKTLVAYVGGGNSFNVMSMKLTLEQEEWERKWDYDRQYYEWGKRLSNEKVKPKNNESKYRGFASYANDDEGSVFVIASYDQKKKDDDQFVCLYIDKDLNLKETKMPVSGNYSLVYCDQLESGNIFAILAPNKGMPDISKYVYLEFTPKADLVTNTAFTAPAPNMAILDYREVKGGLYFCGASTKSDEAFNRVFTSYAPINNPGYSTSDNRQMDKYEKSVFGEDFDKFHLLKFENGQLSFASTTPIKSFESKVKTPPSQKKAHAYEGKTFKVQNLAITPAGEYLVTGQIEKKKIVNKGKDIEYRYYDIVYLHFDAKGKLKAQYAVEKMNDDSKSEKFQSIQNFFISQDGKTVYWEILEVKGTKGYTSIMDAYNGDPTFIANYFPRIAKINLTDASLSDFTVLGDEGKFLMYRNHSYLTDKNTNVRYYLGHDKDYEKLWVGSYQLE